MMPRNAPLDTEEEAQWRAEFETDGEAALRDAFNYRNVPFPELKRRFAFRWLREQEQARQRRERELHRDVRRTLWAAVAAVLVGIIGVAVTLSH
jgi:hypothetical protein